LAKRPDRVMRAVRPGVSRFAGPAAPAGGVLRGRAGRADEAIGSGATPGARSQTQSDPLPIKVLTELQRTENDAAGILNDLADRNGSDLSARRRREAAEASAAARRAGDRAQALRELAVADAIVTLPGRTPAAAEAAGTSAPVMKRPLALPTGGRR